MREMIKTDKSMKTQTCGVLSGFLECQPAQLTILEDWFCDVWTSLDLFYTYIVYVYIGLYRHILFSFFVQSGGAWGPLLRFLFFCLL